MYIYVYIYIYIYSHKYIHIHIHRYLPTHIYHSLLRSLKRPVCVLTGTIGLSSARNGVVCISSLPLIYPDGIVRVLGLTPYPFYIQPLRDDHWVRGLLCNGALGA